MEWNRERLATRGLAVLIAYAAIRSVVNAALRPLWYDELYTVGLARQPRVSAIWDALRHAVDTFPPPFYLVERVAGTLLSDEHIAFRLPSILGFCCVVLCVFIFVRKRSGSMCALLCAAVPLLSTLYSPYAMEARGYGPLAACLAVALVCYQRGDSIRWTLLMAFSLAAAEAFHYYAVFAFLPFALAEVALLFETRRLRPSVWLALLCGVVPLAMFWPLLLSVKRYYGGDFWARPTLFGLADVYGWFLRLPVSWGIALAVVAALWLFAPPAFRRSGKLSAVRSTDAPFHECVLILGLLALPCEVFVAVKIAHGGLANRYVLPTVLGFPLAAGYILPRFDRKVLTLFGAFLFCGVAVQEAFFWVPLFHYHQFGKIISPAAGVEELVNSAGYLDLPVVVSDGHKFLQIVHYASPVRAKRFVCVVDVPKAAIYARFASVDKNLLVLRFYLPLQVYEFQDFAANHPSFLLYSSGGELDWWPTCLLNDGYSLKLVAVQENHKGEVYLVSKKGDMGDPFTTRTPGTQ